MRGRADAERVAADRECWLDDFALPMRERFPTVDALLSDEAITENITVNQLIPKAWELEAM